MAGVGDIGTHLDCHIRRSGDRCLRVGKRQGAVSSLHLPRLHDWIYDCHILGGLVRAISSSHPVNFTRFPQSGDGSTHWYQLKPLARQIPAAHPPARQGLKPLANRRQSSQRGLMSS
jgi:hypothetical protein